MNKRTEEMQLSSAGLLLLLTAAAMTLFADPGPRTPRPAELGGAYQHIVK